MEPMDGFMLDRLRGLCEVHAVSGYEQTLASKIEREARGHADDVRTDALGNVIAHIRGSGPKVMVTAHLDEIGLMVRHIDKKGFLFFAPVGGQSSQNLFARACTVKTDDGQLLPGLVNHMNPGRPRSIADLPSIDGFFIDVGASSREEVEEMGIEIGNTVSLDYEFRRLGDHKLMGKALDNRALILIQLESMRRISKSGVEHNSIPDLYFVFTVQEEVGARGAKTAAYTINPDIAVALDIAVANDLPGTNPREIVTELDAGPAIKVMDRLSTSPMGLIAAPRVVREMKNAARKHGIPYQLEVFLAGSTDAATIHLERQGVASGALLLPTRYVHAHELISERDVTSMIELLIRYLESAA